MFSQVIGRHMFTMLLSEKGLVIYHGKFVETLIWILSSKERCLMVTFFFYPENPASLWKKAPVIVYTSFIIVRLLIIP